MSNLPKPNTQSIARTVFAAALPVCVVLAPAQAFAYIGPGAGLSAIGSFLALLAAVLVTIVGFVWYPVKRLLKKNKASVATEPAETNTADVPPQAMPSTSMNEEKPAE